METWVLAPDAFLANHKSEPSPFSPKAFCGAGISFGKVALFDRGSRPEGLQQLGFVECPPRPPRQDQQEIEGLRRKSDNLAIPPQLPFPHVELERAEPVLFT